MFNSKFDLWQIDNILELPCYTQKAHPCSKAEQALLLQYGVDFMKQFTPVSLSPKHGAVITSCVCHGCAWANLKVNGQSSYWHYAQWCVVASCAVASLATDDIIVTQVSWCNTSHNLSRRAGPKR